MSNHWHFVLWPESDGDLAAFMQQLTNTHVKRWNERKGDGGHLKNDPRPLVCPPVSQIAALQLEAGYAVHDKAGCLQGAGSEGGVQDLPN